MNQLEFNRHFVSEYLISLYEYDTLSYTLFSYFAGENTTHSFTEFCHYKVLPLADKVYTEQKDKVPVEFQMSLSKFLHTDAKAIDNNYSGLSTDFLYPLWVSKAIQYCLLVWGYVPKDKDGIFFPIRNPNMLLMLGGKEYILGLSDFFSRLDIPTNCVIAAHRNLYSRIIITYWVFLEKYS